MEREEVQDAREEKRANVNEVELCSVQGHSSQGSGVDSVCRETSANKVRQPVTVKCSKFHETVSQKGLESGDS
jgi:hypothetical protein